ncbi:MAG: hypothetical protein L0Y42_02235, partial [Phycisphaerales bacterium]|nr:hypothetical protein [Phycisphaerales bacterium]
MSRGEGGASIVITRTQAARLLKQARKALWDDAGAAGEEVGWAVSALPQSRSAVRLKVDYLQMTGHFDSADALIAQSLMRQADHPLMRLRHARSLHAQDRVEQADREVRRVLNERPEHGAALKLAAAIATQLGQHHRAVELFKRARAHRPLDSEASDGLVESLLRVGAVDEAAKAMESMPGASPVLRARVLRAAGRMREAIDLLEGEALWSTEQDESAARELIVMLDQAGDTPGLRSFVKERVFATADAAVTASWALLAIGEYGAALSVLDQPTQGGRAAQALDLKVIANACQGRNAQALNELENA